MGLRERKRINKIKQCVINRDGFICCYCNKELNTTTVTMEHIVPESKNGTFNTTNLTVSCASCNNNRGNKSFFEYCNSINLPQSKIEKYKKLYLKNLKIKILNISKERLTEDYAIPNELIRKSCHILKIKNIDLSPYQSIIKFDEMSDSRSIKCSFEKIIKNIESDI